MVTSVHLSKTISAQSVHALQHTEEHLSLPSSSRSPNSVVPQKKGSCPCKLAGHDHKCHCGPFLRHNDPVSIAASVLCKGHLRVTGSYHACGSLPS